ncbi:MAG TPA: hypothetical protein DIW46_04715 [Microbacterium sp.]|nr:hypothetical protein [Microbacterium sp.]
MSVVTRGASADAIRRFTLTVTMDGADGEALLRLVSVFHRRQIEVLQSTYQRVASTCWMVATVETTEARLRTTALTLRNTIGVTGYEVSPSLDDWHDAEDARVRAPALQELL